MSEQFLKDILEYKKGLIETKKSFFSSLKEKAGKSKRPNIFKQAISKAGQVNLIAEIKR